MRVDAHDHGAGVPVITYLRYMGVVRRVQHPAQPKETDYEPKVRGRRGTRLKHWVPVGGPRHSSGWVIPINVQVILLVYIG